MSETSLFYDFYVSRPLLIMADVSTGGMPLQRMNTMLEAFFAEASSLFEYGNNRVFVNILSFSDSAGWVSPAPVPLRDFCFQPLTATGKSANLENAFQELTQQMCRKAFLCTLPRPHGTPIIFLFSTGRSGDSLDEGMAEFRENRWLTLTEKYQIPIGSPPDEIRVNRFAYFRKITTEVDGVEIPDLAWLLRFALDGPLSGVNGLIPRSEWAFDAYLARVQDRSDKGERIGLEEDW